MAIEDKGEYYEIYDYSLTSTKTYVPLKGQYVYLENVESYIINTLSVLGDGSKQVQALSFREVVDIETDINISLTGIEIPGNKITIENTGSSSIIITGTLFSVDLGPGIAICYKFNGSTWIPLDRENIKYVDGNYTISNNENFTYYKIDTSINKNVSITLPAFASNQTKKSFILQNIEAGIVRVLVQGGDTINGYLTELRLYSRNNFVEIYPSVMGWYIKNQSVNIDSGIINRSDWTNVKIGYVFINYDNVTLGSPQLGGFVQGVSSGAIGKIIGFNATELRLIEIQNGGIFTDNEIINGISFDFTALVNEPSGSNLNKDTNIQITAIGDKINRIQNEFIIYDSNSPTAFLKNDSMAYRTTTPLLNEDTGYSYYYISSNFIALISGIDGINIINRTGNRILLQAQNWYYRLILRIFY